VCKKNSQQSCPIFSELVVQSRVIHGSELRDDFCGSPFGGLIFEDIGLEVSNYAPEIVNWTISQGSPTSCENTTINSSDNDFRIAVSDLNGWVDMEDGGSVEVYFEKSGVYRPSSAPTIPSVCVYSDNDGVNIAYYNCSINMTYYDAGGTGANGWVVIHESSNGAPGNILGAQRFDAGAYSGGSVELLRDTLAGQTYFAMLHLDNNDKSFDHNTDLPVLDDTERIVMTSFNAQ